jgi:cellulose synthase/poly-beta-1,6-N-acetylglucosamine synthase-like glycosyltransferase
MAQPLATVPSKRRHPDEAGERSSDVLLPILISIIVPMRNGAEYLDECFESVANQTNIDPR